MKAGDLFARRRALDYVIVDAVLSNEVNESVLGANSQRVQATLKGGNLILKFLICRLHRFGFLGQSENRNVLSGVDAGQNFGVEELIRRYEHVRLFGNHHFGDCIGVRRATSHYVTGLLALIGIHAVPSLLGRTSQRAE